MTDQRDLIREAKNGPWQRFLQALVGRNRPVSVEQLDHELSELTRRKGDARGEIYAYLSARQRVGVNRAFWIGEALRECGVGWSSGVIGLAVASHLEELVALLSLLTLRTDGEERCGALLAACCAVLALEAPNDSELAALQNETRERLATTNLAALDEVREAWDALSKRAGSYGRLFASVTGALRDAYASARLEDHSKREQRVFEDLRRWATSVAEDNPRLLEIVQVRFACRARIEQRRMSSVYMDAVLKLYRSDIDAPHMSFDQVLREKPRTLEQIAHEDYGIALPPNQHKPRGRRTATKGKKQR